MYTYIFTFNWKNQLQMFLNDHLQEKGGSRVEGKGIDTRILSIYLIMRR